MFQMYEKKNRCSIKETLRRLAQKFTVLLATIALFGSLYLVILLGE